MPSSARRCLKALAIIIIILLEVADAKRIAKVYWNSSNPIFSLAYGPTLTFAGRLRDQLQILCPGSQEGSSNRRWRDEVSIIYMVKNKHAVSHCFLPGTEQIVAYCNQNNGTAEGPITIVLRKFSPMPNALEFRPGGTYYFYSTSTGTKEGFRNRVGGLCQTKNMRFSLMVLDREAPETQVGMVISDYHRYDVHDGRESKIDKPMSEQPPASADDDDDRLVEKKERQHSDHGKDFIIGYRDEDENYDDANYHSYLGKSCTRASSASLAPLLLLLSVLVILFLHMGLL